MSHSANHTEPQASMFPSFLNLYRQLPWFKGKLRLGKLLFSRYIDSVEPTSFRAHHKILYKIPNTKENLGVELLINGIYEKDIVRFLLQQMVDGDTFFDIGANIGSIALPVLKKKRNINYYGFEASPIVFKYLRDNLERNISREVHLCNNVVHNQDDIIVPFYEADLYGKSSMAPTYTDRSIPVISVSLDQFCKKNGINKIDWMKVDVQGFELYVFQGMKELLAGKKIANILFEFEAWADEQAGIKERAAQYYLESAGYTLYGIDGELLSISKKKTETMIWARLC